MNLDERAREIIEVVSAKGNPLDKQTKSVLELLFTEALTQVRRETLEEAVREAEAYGDACVLAEFTHGNKKATKHGVGASKAIADALRSRIQEGDNNFKSHSGKKEK